MNTEKSWTGVSMNYCV